LRSGGGKVLLEGGLAKGITNMKATALSGGGGDAQVITCSGVEALQEGGEVKNEKKLEGVSYFF